MCFFNEKKKKIRCVKLCGAMFVFNLDYNLTRYRNVTIFNRIFARFSL